MEQFGKITEDLLDPSPTKRTLYCRDDHCARVLVQITRHLGTTADGPRETQRL